jgi:hypothetical protein
MARQTNGTNQSLQSASAIDLSSFSKLAIQMWLWWDTFADDDDLAMELHADFDLVTDAFLINPNSSSTTRFEFATGGLGNYNAKSFTRPSSGAWHHYLFNYDRSLTGAAEHTGMYLDSISQTLTTDSTFDTGGAFGSRVLYLMTRGNTTLFAAGRIAEVAIWGGVNLSGAEVTSLYNSGKGAAATSVQGSSLAHYWRLIGTQSPEPATVGGVAMTVNGATSASHPFSPVRAGTRNFLVGRRR